MQARACFAEEDARWHSKVAGALGRILRNPPPGINMPVSCYDPIRKYGLTMGAGERGGRPNLVDIEARLCHAFRTTRDRQRVYLVCSSLPKSYFPQSHSCPPLSATIAAPRRSAPRILRNSSPQLPPSARFA